MKPEIQEVQFDDVIEQVWQGDVQYKSHVPADEQDKQPKTVQGLHDFV